MRTLGRQTHLAWVLLTAAVVPWGGGCSTEAFCFECGEGAGGAPDASPLPEGGGSGGTMIGDGSLGDSVLGDTGSCTADLESDPLNCGACGHVCEIANAHPKCESRFCVIDRCASGFYDDNGEVADGCEYECEPLRDQNGDPVAEESVCDGKDDDCDGLTDETFDFEGDVSHCGGCSVACTPPANSVMRCASGECEFDRCLDTYEDSNNDINAQSIADETTDGCECNLVGDEDCNLVDDDCDGQIDEGIDLTSDAANCGACGNLCGDIFPHAVSTCVASTCVFGSCLPGHFDIDGELLNGCEYACTPSDPPTESCNGVDDDCNGFADDGTLAGVGDPCGSAVGECKQGAMVCVTGGLACVGDVKPATELCDGVNNDCDGTGANGDVDEGCPSASAATRLDLGGSTAGQHSTAQLTVASQDAMVFAAYLDRRSGNADIRMNYLSSAGGAWQGADLLVTGTAANEVEPWAFTSPSRVYVAYGLFGAGTVRRIQVARSALTPGTWTLGQAEKSAAAGADSFFVRGVYAGANGGADRIVVVWQRLDGASRDVILQASSDGGATWLAADLRVNSVAGKAELPTVASDGQGKAFIAWRDVRGAQPEIYADVYDFGTGTLGGNKKLSLGNPTQQPAIAADSAGNVHVVWTDLPPNDRKRIRAATSTDGGGTFGASVVINTPDFADASTPDVIARSGRAIAVWQDNRSGLSDIYANVWSSATSSWRAQASRADGGPRGAYRSTVPKVAFGAGDMVFVTYQEYRGTGSNGLADVYANFSRDGALTFQPIDVRLDLGIAGASDSTTPYVAAPAPGAAPVMVWLDTYTPSGNASFADVYAGTLSFP